jgi:hypothetical protein
MAVVLCEPRAADWCVQAVVGTTFCPCLYDDRNRPNGKSRCQNQREHNRQYGTDTREYCEYFRGDKPKQSDVSARLGRGWYVIEFKAQRTPQSRRS